MMMKLANINKKATVSASIATRMSSSLAKDCITRKYVKNLR
jgi:hypothetical protein